ncbi:imidazolonepropionase [Streptococcus parauberis]|uniref:Imidazolonepropionase n=2 Tax=Streptococcus parauberis TaxID=1348 RepID=A0A0E2UDI0_9STRE|nr:imidazolonepropionase [Streptococcus parauberis]AUT05611.1 Imidazolonepropionase [Streptococcus parauberis]EMF49417.1 Imidazolonepropionase [Streptococcus parauberis KRS-02109]EMG26369.1 Imidazolonepropionase [Streptococcus parauberis KRS-02083]MDT2730847.1 imidazolonepropionase [Streptococcus parauberis]MDT2748183.1 imidazolonepropionase [Streptococcus parauberis]
MSADLLLVHFDQVFCPQDMGHPLYGDQMKNAQILDDGYIAIKDGKILAVGSGQPDSDLIGPATKVKSYEGKIATPGLIDCHTHLVYGGSREHEFSKKLNGVSYLEILAQGGGILSTVKATREADFDNLYQKSAQLLDYMLLHGTTTVEAKSGYGLNWETEERQLQVVKQLNADHQIDLVSTFMAAHAIPTEYKGHSKDYLDHIINEMLPKVKDENLAEFCDIFCEKGVFTADESRYLLSKAKELGFKLRIHADEIESIGGVDVAAELEAVSAEHLMMATDQGIEKMAKAKVIGNLLPATTFSLMEDTYAPAKKMIDAGMAITLSTDSNPGSCPTANLQFVMQLGCFMMRLTPIEVLNSVTINAAYSVNRQETIGSFDEGKIADIAIFNANNIDYPFYFFATNLIHHVYKNGKLVVKEGHITK